MKYISCHVYNKNRATNEVCRCDEMKKITIYTDKEIREASLYEVYPPESMQEMLDQLMAEKKRLRGAISWASGKLVDAGDDKSADRLLGLLDNKEKIADDSSDIKLRWWHI